MPAAEARIRGISPPDASEEAIFGEDGDGIDQEDGDVDEAAEAEEAHGELSKVIIMVE